MAESITPRTYSVGYTCLTSRESEGEPQVSEGDEFVWLARGGGNERGRVQTGTFSIALGCRRQQANTQRYYQVYQMKAVTHATFINVRRHALPELPSKTHASLARG